MPGRQIDMQRLDGGPMAGDLVQAGLQIAGHGLPAKGGQLHRAVFGKDQQVGPGLRHPSGQLGGIGVEGVEPVDGIGGGGDLHSGLIQNCRVLSVSDAWPRSFQAKRATAPSSGA